MARPYRLQSEDCFYHITSRGNERKKIFLNDNDFERFLEYILTAKGKYGFYLFAYVLMSNHYHLLIKTTKSNLSRIMHYINGSYTKYFNVKRGRTGHLFQGRYEVARFLFNPSVKSLLAPCKLSRFSVRIKSISSLKLLATFVSFTSLPACIP